MSASLQVAVPLDRNQVANQEEQANNSLIDNDIDNDRQDSSDHANSSANQLPVHHTRSAGQTLLNYINSGINSGPMSEGHVRLYNNETRPSDPSQNLCLFTPCLFLVGCAIFTIGVTLYARHKFVWVGIFLVSLGSFSAFSSVLYTFTYVFMFGLRQTRSNQELVGRSTRSKSNYASDANANGNAGFDQFGDFETLKQTTATGNGALDLVNEGSGLCGSNYVPQTTDSVQLNVESLDFEFKSTQNLDASSWRTINGSDPPQSYLESFGQLPTDLLSSPTLKKGLEGYGEGNGRERRKKRSIFDSLRNGQPFSKSKSTSQTELLDSENEGENTLFHIESIGKELDPPAGTSNGGTAYQIKQNAEEVRMENATGNNSSIVVHFNRKNSDNLIDTFH